MAKANTTTVRSKKEKANTQKARGRIKFLIPHDESKRVLFTIIQTS